MGMPAKLHTITCRAPEDLWRRLKALAGLEGKSINAEVLEILDQYLTEERLGKGFRAVQRGS